MDIQTYGALINKIKDNKPTDAQVEQAVSDWLDDHPEATTTVEDGSITYAKLDSNLKEKADDVVELKSQTDALTENALILAETLKALNHEGLQTPKEIVFYGNENAFSNACYADGVNYLNGNDRDYSVDGIRVYGSGLFRTVTGTATATNDATIYSESFSLLPGDYLLKISIDKGNSVFGTAKNGYIYLTYTDNTNRSYTYSCNGNSVEAIVTAEKEVKSIRITLGYRSTWVFDGFKAWLGLFDSTTNFVDTGVYVPSESSITYTLTAASAAICTMQHESVVQYIVDTKTYVDGHIPSDMLTESDLVYISPEMYGAVGDGVSDDTNAVQACINAAIATAGESNKTTAIRGYGCYKISDSITITGRQHDIYLHYIRYTGSDAAIILQCVYSKIVFDTIYADIGGASACGLRAQDMFTQNQLQLMYARCNGNVVEFRKTSGTNGDFYYNRITTQVVISVNANIFYFAAAASANENSFYGALYFASNGYLAYFDHDNAGNGSGNPTIRFHGFCFENAANCVYGNAQLIGCRFVEGENKQTSSDRTKGYVFNFDGVRPEGRSDLTGGAIDYTAIKIGDAMTYQEALDAAKQGLETGDEDTTSIRKYLGFHNGSYTLIGKCDRVANANLTGSGEVFSGCGVLYAYWNHLAFRPGSPWYRLVDEQVLNTGSLNINDYNYVWPTVFDISVTASTINFDYSYCCIAINDVSIIQHTGKEAVVYDKTGAVIFNGIGKGAGIYHLKCVCDPLDDITFNLTGGQTIMLSDPYIRNVYTGENEHWIVTKEELVES